VEASLREHGCRPLHVFAEAGLVGPRFSAVHLTWPDDAEIATLRALGGRVIACPSTELDLGDGFLPIERIEGIPVAIGTDSHARIDPFGEIAALELHARARLGRRNVLPHAGPDGLAARLLDAGTVEGAVALGVEGGIRVGAAADLVEVKLGVALRAARPLPAVVFAGHPGVVSQVRVGGRPLFPGGQHPDALAIVAEAERVLAP
jgi:formimidoylglutamate deiminase